MGEKPDSMPHGARYYHLRRKMPVSNHQGERIRLGAERAQARSSSSLRRLLAGLLLRTIRIRKNSAAVIHHDRAAFRGHSLLDHP